MGCGWVRSRNSASNLWEIAIIAKIAISAKIFLLLTDNLEGAGVKTAGMATELQQQLCERIHKFAVRIVALSRYLLRKRDSAPLGNQVLRSGTSVAANYRAACRSRSRADFVSKMSVVAEEADETLFWLELLRDCGIVAGKRLEPLIDESRQLTAIFTASRNTAKSRGI